jgi:hypothetical protein
MPQAKNYRGLTIKRALALLIVLFGLSASGGALARGGQSADDCPPGSKDPDCRSSSHPP